MRCHQAPLAFAGIVRFAARDVGGLLAPSVRRLAVASVALPSLFWTLVVIAGALRDAYDHARQAISELGVGQNAALHNVTFLWYGVLTLWIAVGLGRALPRGARGGMSIFAASGVAIALLGVQWFAWTAAGAEPGPGVVGKGAPGAGDLSDDSAFDLGHDLLAAVAFSAGGLAAVATGLGLRGVPGWRGYDVYFVASGGVVLALLAYGAVSEPELPGLAQRVMSVTIQQWIAVLAIRHAAYTLGRSSPFSRATRIASS